MTSAVWDNPDLSAHEESAWKASYRFRGKELTFVVTDERIEEKVRDQISICGSRCRAIFRAVEKKIVRDLEKCLLRQKKKSFVRSSNGR